MKPALQAKLLHVLQDAEFTKLGSNKRIQVDVRIVAATNRDLEKMMVSGEFREDLYYRLKVIELTVPALRERPRRDPDADRLLRRALLAQVQPAGATDLRRAAAAVRAVRLAGQHPRAREHDQAGRDPAGRAAGRARDPAEHAARRRRAGGCAGCRRAAGRGRGRWRCRRRCRSACRSAAAVPAGRGARERRRRRTRPSRPRKAAARSRRSRRRRR